MEGPNKRHYIFLVGEAQFLGGKDSKEFVPVRGTWKFERRTTTELCEGAYWTIRRRQRRKKRGTASGIRGGENKKWGGQDEKRRIEDEEWGSGEVQST